jgi:SAM-dependent methyltransferase
MTDAELDDLFPAAARRVSRRYWSSVAVARRAAALLADLGVRRLLDVGSGPGKFCIVAGARAPRLELVGVEHRPHLFAIARSLAADVGVDNVTFRLGDVTRLAWADFDAFYVYNTFAENKFTPDQQFDHTVTLSEERRITELLRVEHWLAAAPVGTVVMTYHGLGGPIPASYERVHVEAADSGWLQAWRRRGTVTSGTYWLEDGPDVDRVRIESLDRWLRQAAEDASVDDA